MRKPTIHRPTPTAAIAMTALVFSLTGSSYAAVTAAKNSVRSTSIVNGTIKSVDLKNGSVTAAKLGTGAVTGFSLSDGSVATPKLADGSVSTPKIADGAVTTPKIADASVNTPKIADGSVTTPKIADGSVSQAKLALDAKPIFAVVAGSNGVLNRGSGHITGSSRTAVGRYTVVTDRDVTACAYQATLGGITTNLYNGSISAAQAPGNPNAVALRVTNPAGVDTDHSFHLNVVC